MCNGYTVKTKEHVAGTKEERRGSKCESEGGSKGPYKRARGKEGEEGAGGSKVACSWLGARLGLGLVRWPMPVRLPTSLAEACPVAEAVAKACSVAEA